MSEQAKDAVVVPRPGDQASADAPAPAVSQDSQPSVSSSGSAEPSGPGARGARDKEGIVGRVVNDKYRVIGVIARGGMGAVYRAEQLPLGRPVALKLIHSELDEEHPESDFQRRFFLEAASCAKLTHPNIVVIYDYGRLELSPGRHSAYMAMELLEGRTLHEVLKREAPLAFGRALRIGREVARALREAHRQDMVHRDLKPTNVMLKETRDGESVKVLDFGLVKLMHDDSEELTREGLFMGSPKYMAPEQIRREAVDGRADLYALGVLLYQMLTGRVPFEGDNQIQTLMAHVNDAVPPLPAEVPAEVRDIVMCCLAKGSDARYPSADELIAAIDEAIVTLGVAAAGVVSGDNTVPPREKETTVSRKVAAAAALASATAPASAGVAASGTSSHIDIEIDTGPSTAPVTTSRSLLWVGVAGLVVVLGGLGVIAWLARGESPAPLPIDAPVAVRPEGPAIGGPAVEGPRSFTVFVDSEPSGADVFRGEQRVGATPTFVRLEPADLAAGGVAFRVALDGHSPYVWTQGPSSQDVHVRAPLVALAPSVETASQRAPAIDRVVPRRDRPRDRVRPEPEQRPAPPEDVVIKTRR